jgi:hypothetical protein
MTSSSSGRFLISPKIIRDAHLEVKNKSPLKGVSAGALNLRPDGCPSSTKDLSESMITKSYVALRDRSLERRHTHCLPGNPRSTV